MFKKVAVGAVDGSVQNRPNQPTLPACHVVPTTKSGKRVVRLHKLISGDDPLINFFGQKTFRGIEEITSYGVDINSGNINLDPSDGSFNVIAGAESGTTDDLDTVSLSISSINNSYPLIISAATGDTITLKHDALKSANSLFTQSGGDVTVTGDEFVFFYRKNTVWYEVFSNKQTKGIILWLIVQYQD